MTAAPAHATPAPTRTELAAPESFKAAVNWMSRRGAEIGNFLEDLRLKRGNLTTDVIIEAASKQGSVLRDFFEWQSTKAAHKYRRLQARQLMARLHVEAPKIGPLRAFVPVQIKGEPTQKLMYIPLTAALQSDQFRAEIIARLRSRAKTYEAHLATIQAYRRSL